MRRRGFLWCALAASATLGLLESTKAGDGSTPRAERPNIIFLITDDQHWHATGCAGNSIIKTPNMDRLAAEGVMFHNNFVTASICNASRARIFMGCSLTIIDLARRPIPQAVRRFVANPIPRAY